MSLREFLGVVRSGDNPNREALAAPAALAFEVGWIH